MISNKVVYLVSSNSRELYLRDVLSVVGAPEGQTIHFRYRSKWVDTALRSQLPTKTHEGGFVLRRYRFVILFLEQKRRRDDKPGFIWGALFPLRIAWATCCYKTGDTEEDYCHFYFTLGGFTAPRQLPLERFNHRHFAGFLSSPLPGETVSLEERAYDEGGFIRLASFLSEGDSDSLDNRFKSLETGRSYVPIFVCVLGVNRGIAFGRPRSVKPIYNNDVRGRLYLLKEDSLYSIWVSVFTPIPSAGDIALRLAFNDKDVFGINVERLELSSRYDSHYFGITSVATGTVRETFLEVHVNLSGEEPASNDASRATNNSTPISASIQIPVRIQPLRGKKLAKWAEETFLVVTTTLLATIGILTKLAQAPTSPPASPAKHSLWGHDIPTTMLADPLLAVLCLVGPFFALYLLIKFLLLWNWKYAWSAVMSLWRKALYGGF